MTRGLSSAQERGLIILIGLAIVAAGIAIFIPEFRRPRIPPPVEVILPDVRVIVPEFLSSRPRIDLNSAGVEELTRLPGIGETLAQRIVAYRQEHGPFRSVDKLKNVPGIGEKTVEEIKDSVSLGGP